VLTIVVKGDEYINDKQEFVYPESFELNLEHSLVSLSKWESKFEKPFLAKGEKTAEEILGYIEAMVIDTNPPADYIEKLSEENLEEINGYINAKMTATWFNDIPNAPQTSRETITSELIYYWMTVFTIPFECENWHLSRLFTLIRICNLKAEKPKKMSQAEIARRNRELNAQRRSELGTSG
jgi:macrodomain Ter protein organizer (MatP/YcbG family)